MNYSEIENIVGSLTNPIVVQINRKRAQNKYNPHSISIFKTSNSLTIPTVLDVTDVTYVRH